MDKPKDDRISELEKENTDLKQQIEYDSEYVKAARDFLTYINCELWKHIPDVFKMHSEEHWANLGKYTSAVKERETREEPINAK